MHTSFDVVIVGARAAGAARALLLARRGHRVLLIDRDRLPSDIARGHFVYRDGPRRLHSWGLLEPVIASGAPAVTTPVREYLDRGFKVAGGTDSAVVPYPPLWVIYHFVTRDTISGGVLGADQKITRKEALQLETINNAYLTFEEKIKGSIEPGKLADLIVLPEDILTCPEKHIEQMQVSMTMVGGKIVYRRPYVNPYVQGNASSPYPL